MDVQIFERGRPALVQHLQHVGQFVALARMMLARVVRVMARVWMRVRMVVGMGVHLVRMTTGGGHRGRVVWMVGMAATAVVLLTVARQMVLHVLRRNVLRHVHGRGGTG